MHLNKVKKSLISSFDQLQILNDGSPRMVKTPLRKKTPICIIILSHTLIQLMPTAICPTHALNFNETFAMNIDKKLIICMTSEKTFINPVTTTLVLDIYSNHGVLKHIRQVVNVKLVFPNLPITTSTFASFF